MNIEGESLCFFTESNFDRKNILLYWYNEKQPSIEKIGWSMAIYSSTHSKMCKIFHFEFQWLLAFLFHFLRYLFTSLLDVLNTHKTTIHVGRSDCVNTSIFSINPGLATKSNPNFTRSVVVIIKTKKEKKEKKTSGAK